jgi:hypothetical protein
MQMRVSTHPMKSSLPVITYNVFRKSAIEQKQNNKGEEETT